MDLHPDLVVNAHVRLIKPLRKGGMGTVWVGYHETLETRVAVKFMTGDSVAAKERFAREARAIAKIGSPYIVDVKDRGILGDDTPYIVMELLEGPTLRQYLAARKWMRLDAALRLVDQLGRGLAAAHTKGIIHRDIKPDNIILVESESPEDICIKLLDFGVAKEAPAAGIAPLTDEGTMLGTPRYMSPEQIGGAHAADLRADIWGVGAVTYRALTGRDPFVAATLQALVHKLYSEELTPATELRPELPEAVDEWFSHTLCIEPEQRFSSARAMANAFRHAVHSAARRPPARQAVKVLGSPMQQPAGAPHAPGPSASPVSELHSTDLATIPPALGGPGGTTSSHAGVPPAMLGHATAADEVVTVEMNKAQLGGMMRGQEVAAPADSHNGQLALPDVAASAQTPNVGPDALRGIADRPILDTTTANSMITSEVRPKGFGTFVIAAVSAAAMIALGTATTWLYDGFGAVDQVAECDIHMTGLVKKVGLSVEDLAELLSRMRSDSQNMPAPTARPTSTTKEPSPPLH